MMRYPGDTDDYNELHAKLGIEAHANRCLLVELAIGVAIGATLAASLALCVLW